MMNRCVWTRMLTATAIAAAGMCASATALAVLRPASPASNAKPVRIRFVASETAPATDNSVYYRLDAGEALSFSASGAKTMRIRSRSIQESMDVPGFVRFAIDFGNADTRLWKRISRPRQAGFLIEEGGEQRAVIGEEDVLNLDVPPGTGNVTVRLRDGGSPAVVRVLFGDGASSPGPRSYSGLSRFDGEARVAFGGYDSNPYLSPKDANAAADKAFWPAGFDIRYRGRPSPGFRWEGQYAFQGDFYGDSILNSHDHRLRFKEAWHPKRSAWRFGMDQDLRIRRQTFVGRGDTEAFETSSGTDTVLFGDRFNNLELSLEGFASVALSSIHDLGVSVAYRYRDYQEDYDLYPDIYSLDQTRWDMEVELRTRLGPAWRLKTSTDHEWRLYKEKTSRDRDGNPVSGQFSRLSRHRVRLDLSRVPREGVTVDAGLEGLLRVDHYDGYWNYTGYGFHTEVGWRWREGHRVQAGISYSGDDYKNATVGYTAGGTLRKKTDLRFSMDARYRVRRWLDFNAGFEYRDRGNNSPVFAYTQATVLAGFTFRY